MTPRALVVDDSRVMRGMVIQALLRTGLAEFEFTEAGDGDEALEQFNPRRTDIMFVDWNMPHVTGIDFVRKVRAAGNSNHIPIVMVTSEKPLGKIEEALDRAGADEFVTKPFTIDVLKRKLAPGRGRGSQPRPASGSKSASSLAYPTWTKRSTEPWKMGCIQQRAHRSARRQHRALHCER